MANDRTGCPWCGATCRPVPTDVSVANFIYCTRADIESGRALALNPVMCPECHGVGGFEDWALTQAERAEALRNDNDALDVIAAALQYALDHGFNPGNGGDPHAAALWIEQRANEIARTIDGLSSEPKDVCGLCGGAFAVADVASGRMCINPECEASR